MVIHMVFLNTQFQIAVKSWYFNNEHKSIGCSLVQELFCELMWVYDKFQTEKPPQKKTRKEKQDGPGWYNSLSREYTTA